MQMSCLENFDLNTYDHLQLEHLNEEERTLINELCLDFSDICYFEGDNLPFTNEIKHCINTQNSKPILTRSY